MAGAAAELGIVTVGGRGRVVDILWKDRYIPLIGQDVGE